jgi:uncharacterized membrane protein
MNKAEFMKVLTAQLCRLPEAERADILYDYQEHFAIGAEKGKSEEEIASSLGDPLLIAKQFTADSLVKQASETKSVGSITRAVFAITGLGFFNLVFVLGPFIGLVGILIGLFASAFAVTLSGIALLLTTIAAPIFPEFINLGGISPTAVIIFSIGVTSLGLLFFIGVIALAKLFFKGTLNYLKMNISIIKKQEFKR